MEGHYEIIKELLNAVLDLDGWKALNHECIFAYLGQMRADIELDINYLLELKDLRNSIDYRGTKVGPGAWKQNKTKIKITIEYLFSYVAKRIADEPLYIP